jgi:hypothetical protein
MEVDNMNDKDIDTLIFILKRDYEIFGYTEKLENIIKNLVMEIVKEKVKRDRKFMEVLKNEFS